MTVDGWRIQKAVDSCKDHGGIHHIETIGIVVTCVDGMTYSTARKENE